MTDDLAPLARRLAAHRSGRLLVVTGAGVSLASGIPTFRGTDPGAIWKNEVVEVGTFAYFQQDPVGWWKWISGLADSLSRARPNPAHHALSSLERWQKSGSGDFLLVTQNVDMLHEQAGSKELVKVHGSSDRFRCSRVGCRLGAPSGSLPAERFDLAPFVADPRLENLPRCPECQALLRAHALLFDEYYTEHVDYQFPRVEREAERMDLLLFVGTSFSVGITDLLLRSALARSVPIFSVDPGSHSLGALPIHTIRHKAEEILPALCRLLEEDGSVD